MGEPVLVTGMVLSSMPVGEFDRRLVLLTRERGKITAFARGARRMNSPLMAASNAFAFGTFTVYEGRNSFSLQQASIREYFTGLAAMQPGVYYGFYFLELADYYGREENDETQMLNLLYVSLKAILKEKIPLRLIRRIFELKAMAVNGEYPDFFSCAVCGTSGVLPVFSLKRDGMLCGKCASGEKGGMRLSEAAVYTCRYIVASPLEKLYAFTVKDEVLAELERLMNLLSARYMDRKMKSLQILEMLAGEKETL